MRNRKPKNVIRILHSSFYILHLITASARFFTLHSSLFTKEKVTPILRWYCLPDSPPLLGFNPETSSRVTLASLGIAFQAKLMVVFE